MSDKVREFILLSDRRWPKRVECKEALAAYDAKLEAHAKEVADLRKRVAELEAKHCIELKEG